MTEKVLLHAVLCFPMRGDSILLARKTRHIGEGCFNGYGGGIEGKESPEGAAVRELFEESGLRAHVADLRKIAIVDFNNTKSDGQVFRCRVHVFLVLRWDGEVRPTDEMTEPMWFARDSLPFDEMMLADREWMPPALSAGYPIYAQAWYGPHQRELVRPTEIVLYDEAG